MKKLQNINGRTLSYYWKFTKPDKPLFLYGTFGAVVGIALTDIIPPFIIAKTFDKIQSVSATGQPLQFSEFDQFLWIYIAVSLSAIVVWRTEAWAVWTYVIRSKKRTYEYLFNHIQHMDSRFHANRFGGALVSQVNKFVGAYDRFSADFTWNIVTGVTALCFSLIVLSYTNWRYGIVLGVVMTLHFVVMIHRMRKQAPYNRDVSRKESLQTAKLADNITNIATVRAFASEKQELVLFQKQTTTTTSADLKLMKIQMLNELINHSGTTIVNIVAFGSGVIFITVFNAPVGALYLLLAYTISLTRRLWDFMFILKSLNRTFGDATEMTQILELEPLVRDKSDAEATKIHRGFIEFKNVTFTHESRKEPLFKGLNLRIKPGEKIGLVGHSGSGKTTLVNLLLRFSDIDSGEIVIDGQNIADITLNGLRSSITYVPQEPLLFHRSINENILYGQPSADKQIVRAIAKMANADEFIDSLPDNYETLVGERGVKLSGGQRQRVAIARAMLKNAPILLLDEATSALDSKSEGLVQDALWTLMDRKTTIVIAHRLSTIQRMDRILVMDKGKIVEEGSHRELIAKDGTYAELWAHQSGGFIDE